MSARLLLLSTLLLTLGARAQWGVHAIFPRIERVFADKSTDGFRSPVDEIERIALGYGIGLSVDVSPYSAIGLDLTVRSDISGSDGRTNELRYNNEYFSYGDKAFAATALLHSSYFFLGNHEASPYLGPFLGIRYARRTLVNGSGDWTEGTAVASSVEASRLLIPVGMRIGFRGDLRNAYADVHMMLGYQIGGGAPMFDETYLSSIRAAGFVYGFGLSIGGGRDRRK